VDLMRASRLHRMAACSSHAETLQLVKESVRRFPEREPESLASARLRHFAERLSSAHSNARDR
jgi:hypothetical protein